MDYCQWLLSKCWDISKVDSIYLNFPIPTIQLPYLKGITYQIWVVDSDHWLLSKHFHNSNVDPI